MIQRFNSSCFASSRREYIHFLRLNFFQRGVCLNVRARQAANQIRHKRYPYSKSDELGFELIACIKGSQDELAFRAQAQNIPATFKSLPVIPSSLV